MDKVITCINCPVGCRMKVTLSDSGEFLSVTGNTCPRGAKYAAQECTCPKRIVTAVIPVPGSAVPLSVKTSAPVPKDLIHEIMKILGDTAVSLPVATGDVIIPDVLNTGADIVATRGLYSR
jgi:CxxC motif-containing protein